MCLPHWRRLVGEAPDVPEAHGWPDHHLSIKARALRRRREEPQPWHSGSRGVGRWPLAAPWRRGPLVIAPEARRRPGGRSGRHVLTAVLVAARDPDRTPDKRTGPAATGRHRRAGRASLGSMDGSSRKREMGGVVHVGSVRCDLRECVSVCRCTVCKFDPHAHIHPISLLCVLGTTNLVVCGTCLDSLTDRRLPCLVHWTYSACRLLCRGLGDNDTRASQMAAPASSRPNSMRRVVVLHSSNFCVVDAIPWSAITNMRWHWHPAGCVIHPLHLSPALLVGFLSHPSRLHFPLTDLLTQSVSLCCTLGEQEHTCSGWHRHCQRREMSECQRSRHDRVTVTELHANSYIFLPQKNSTGRLLLIGVVWGRNPTLVHHCMK